MSEIEKMRIEESLTNEQNLFLKELSTQRGECYYQLNKQMIELTLSLSVKETLFSTFYFEEEAVTIWSNYKKQWPVFTKDIWTLKKYQNLALEMDMEAIRERL